MTKIPYTPPELDKPAFNCPHCSAYANHHWARGCSSSGGHHDVPGLKISHCPHCNQFALWLESSLVYPDSSPAPIPNPDLPEDIRTDFEEARSIIARSPRGAAALFRLCIQKLCAKLGESGTNINKDISELVKKGLNPTIQKSLDIVRVIGNEAVHPGTIDLKDNTEVAVKLSQLINIIADAMITQPKMIEALYDDLPAEKRKQITERDS